MNEARRRWRDEPTARPTARPGTEMDAIKDMAKNPLDPFK